jgi:hypothetical protein
MSIQNEHGVNEGNFRELLPFRIDAGDEDLMEPIQTCAKNATYVSWKRQSEILTTCNDLLLQKNCVQDKFC